MPTLVVTSQKGPFESDTVDLNAEQQKAYDTALSVSHGSALVIRGTVPGCGITTLAARLAAADPTGFETISVRALLGGNDRSEFSGKFGAKTLPACTTRIIFHDAEEVLAEAVDELYRHFDAKFPPVILLEGPFGLYDSPTLKSKALYGRSSVVDIQKPVRYDSTEEEDYHRLLIDIVNRKKTLSEVASGFLNNHICDSSRQKRTIRKNHKGEFVFTGSTGICIGRQKATDLNWDAVMKVTADKRYLFASSIFTKLSNPRDKPNFVAVVGTPVRFFKDYVPESEGEKRKKLQPVRAGSIGVIQEVKHLSEKPPLVVSSDDKELVVAKPDATTAAIVRVDGRDVWVTNLKATKSRNTGVVEEALGKQWPFAPAHYLRVQDTYGIELDKTHVNIGGCSSRKDILVALSRVKSWTKVSATGLNSEYIDAVFQGTIKKPDLF